MPSSRAAQRVRRSVCVFPCLLGLLTLPETAAGEQGLLLNANPLLSNDGVVALSWTVPEGSTVRIQTGRDPGFVDATDVYQGSDGATVVTGLPDGEYRFRGRRLSADGSAGQWGPAVQVVVEHHSLGRAFGFFGVGVTVFVATSLLILGGAKREETEV